MTKESGIIQLSHLEQTIYFASQRQGLHLLDADFATDLFGISRAHGTQNSGKEVPSELTA